MPPRAKPKPEDQKVVRLQADQVTNDGQDTLDLRLPYIVTIAIRGTCPILFHRWSNEAVEAKAKSTKGSKAKKTDDVESYLYRDSLGNIALPGEYLRQSIINAAKYRQDPRSPRKSAMDLTKAAIVSLTDLAPVISARTNTHVDEPDMLDQRRVVVQRSAITRTRPAMDTGWSAEIDVMINLAEYIDESFLRQLIDDAGRLIGVGDFRPSYGRFSVVKFELRSTEEDATAA